MPLQSPAHLLFLLPPLLWGPGLLSPAPACPDLGGHQATRPAGARDYLLIFFAEAGERGGGWCGS